MQNSSASPTVSVVIPTYRHRDFVLQTLETVWAQTFTDFEVIVVNDGSPDDSAQLLRPLAQSGRIRYIEQENQGQAVARNRGLQEARGEFVAFLDDDDLWPPQKLARQVAELRAHPQAVLVYGHIETVPTENQAALVYTAPESPTGQVKRQFLARNWIVTPGQTLIRATTLRELGGFDTTLWGVDDWDLYIRLAKRGDFIYRVELALQYRLHTLNASKNSWRMYQNARRLQRKHFGSWPKPRDISLWWQSRRFLGKYASDMAEAAEQMAQRGQKTEALKMWCRSITMQPHPLTRTTAHTVFKRIVPLLWNRNNRKARA